MKKYVVTFCLAFSSALCAVSVLAHDPEEHVEESQKLDCSVMEKMDHKNMDMNDAVMQAMMKKCMNKMKRKESDSAKGHGQSNESHEHDHNEKRSEKSVKSSSPERGNH